MKKSILLVLGSTFIFSFFISCKSIPTGAESVSNFDLLKYLGKWYEIARLDFKYEKNMDSTTALYTLNNDGSVKVTNCGYNYVTSKNQEAVGKAKFRGKDTSTAELKVSFFGPFYAGYNVIALDENYQYALIAGSSTKYLWILSRTTTIPDDVKEKYLDLAKSVGYNIDDLVWVNQSR